MLVACPSCGKRVSDRAPACPFCKAERQPVAAAESPTEPAAPPEVSEPAPPPPPAASVPAVKTVPPPSVPFPPTDDPTATLPPSPALFRRGEFVPPPEPPPPPPVPTPVEAAPLPLPEEPPAAPTPASASDRGAIDAADHFSAGRFEEALAAADTWLSTHPRDGEALNTRAQALFKLGKRKEAALAIVKAIEAAPDCLLFWFNKAVMEQEDGKAKKAFRSALDLVEMAQLHEAESPFVDKGREMIAAFEKTGAFPDARGYHGWLGLGCVSMKAGRPEAALEFFDRAINATSSKPDGFRWKGKALIQLDQIDEAFVLFDAALEIAPDDPDVHYDRGMAFAILGDAEGAIEAFDAALAIDPHHAPSLKEKQDLV